MPSSCCEICSSDVVVNAKYGSEGYLELLDGTFICRRHISNGVVQIFSVVVDGKCREVKIDVGE